MKICLRRAAVDFGGVDFADTIVAPITGSSKAAVAIVRLSGQDAHRFARCMCPEIGEAYRHAYYTTVWADGHRVDDGLCTLFGDGASYTGEDVAEISCHGSPAVVAAIVAEAVRLGARWARPGEFTERAFLSGRLDLSQAEAVAETVDAATVAQARRATSVRAGGLYDLLAALEIQVAGALAAIEAVVDFSDDVGELDRHDTRSKLWSAAARIKGLLAGIPTSRLLRRGLRVALVGRPNVGKSSILNALLDSDRAIVTDVPGTTRDTLEEAVSIAGYPVVLTDTAGIRESADAVEALGIARSRAAIEEADAVWLVFEAPAGITDDDRSLAEGIDGVVWVANKSDIGRFDGDAVSVSALSSEGVEPLREWIVAKFEAGHEEPLANERHEPDLEAALEAIENAIDTLDNVSLPVDLVCVDLYDALDRLGRITGRTAPDEVIRRVFESFCIGK